MCLNEHKYMYLKISFVSVLTGFETANKYEIYNNMKQQIFFVAEGTFMVSKMIYRWMTCNFMSFSTVFQSCQDDRRMLIKGCAQWNPVRG